MRLTRTINAAIKVTKKHYKFGVEVPYTASLAIMMDKDNQNNLWKVVIERQINDIDALNILSLMTIKNTYGNIISLS